MNTLWNKLSRGKRYRTQFVSANARRAFAFQLRAIMRRRNLSQKQLAEMCGLSQGVISRASDPKYGKLTDTIKIRIANGLDMAYLGTLVPVSEAAKWFLDLSEEAVQVPTFDEENRSYAALPQLGSAEAEIPGDSWESEKTKIAKPRYGSAEQRGLYLLNQRAA